MRVLKHNTLGGALNSYKMKTKKTADFIFPHETIQRVEKVISAVWL